MLVVGGVQRRTTHRCGNCWNPSLDLPSLSLQICGRDPHLGLAAAALEDGRSLGGKDTALLPKT